MPEGDREKTSEPTEEASAEAQATDLASSFSRMLSTLKQRAEAGPAAVRWLAAWQPLVAALHSLGVTVTKLIWRARQAQASGEEGPLIDEETREEFESRFDALRVAFPAVSELFFGVDEFDRLLRETLDNPQARESIVSFARLVEARMNALIAQLVEWALAEEVPDLSMERLEGFVRGLEALLQEALEQWVLPRLYGYDD